LKQYLTIHGDRPDRDHLTFRGSENEASSVLLKGTLVLCTTEPLKAQDITLRFTGEARTSLSYMTAAPGPRFIKQDTEFFRHDWSFTAPTSGKSNTIAAGNHEWPFELVLSGDMPESIEGFYNNWVVYRLKAVVDRGRFARNLEARHHIRLIRTFDASSLELVHAMVRHNRVFSLALCSSI
jgi:arrestin-related trafficking adapter 4/5/7